MLVLSWLMTTAAAGARHPCTPADDLGPGRSARRSMVVFPLAADDAAVTVEGQWQGTSVDGGALDGPTALLLSVTQGLFAVDWPLRRFDAWHTTETAVFDEPDTLTGIFACLQTPRTRIWSPSTKEPS